MDIKCIILITDSLGFARKTIDFLLHFGQIHFLAVYSVLRLLLFSGLSHEIKFWDYLNKTKLV